MSDPTPTELNDAARIAQRADLVVRCAPLMFDGSPVGKAFVADSNHFIAANTAFCSMIGYSEAELVRLKWTDITHPQDIEADLENVRRTASGQMESYEMLKRYIAKFGAIIEVLIRVHAIRDSGGKLICYLVHVLPQHRIGGASFEAHAPGVRDHLNQSEVWAVKILAFLRTNWPVIFFLIGGLLSLIGWVVKELTGKN